MSEHKYTELAARLRTEIRAGVYISGQRLPSENELAAQTGFSRQTVRQAMSLLEKEGLTIRVQGSGTYVRAEGRRRESTMNVAVVTTYIGEYIFPAILHGIDHVLAKSGYTPLLSATRNRVENERRVLSDLLNKPIDGMIVEGTKTALPNPNIDLYERFKLMGIPVVFINGFYPDLQDPVYVVADDRAGGRMACEALLKQGCRRVAGVFKSDDIQGHRRYAGYAEALLRAGVSVRDDDVLWYATENRDALLLSELPQTLAGCDAVVCYNDETALRVLRSDAAKGLALASFDHSTYAQMSAVPFFSLANPKERLGRLAAEKLLRILDGQPESSAVLPWSIEDDRNQTT